MLAHLVNCKLMFHAGGNCGSGSPRITSTQPSSELGPEICAHPCFPARRKVDDGTSNSTHLLPVVA